MCLLRWPSWVTGQGTLFDRRRIGENDDAERRGDGNDLAPFELALNLGLVPRIASGGLFGLPQSVHSHTSLHLALFVVSFVILSSSARGLFLPPDIVSLNVRQCA